MTMLRILTTLPSESTASFSTWSWDLLCASPLQLKYALSLWSTEQLRMAGRARTTKLSTGCSVNTGSCALARAVSVASTTSLESSERSSEMVMEI